jgi:glycosyltransferase involved in cell wall biosynthesis
MLREETRGCENIYLVDQVMNRDEINSLISLTDCLVSLHRSEGFGLGPAEAMSLGKPVILTRWSGNVDYMKKDNSIGIDYELVTLGKDYGPYKSTQHWAEPDIEQAAYWMKRLAQEPELAKKIGISARQTIASDFSPEAVGKLIAERLKYIRAGFL